MKGNETCPKCGAKKVKMLGHCRICLLTVCSACGNKQVANGSGEVCTHSECLVDNLHQMESTFRFVKLRHPKIG